ncbi:MDR family oxidoreductase [Bosea sp. 685]|uniref:acrylyl-CoA reductase (NADPH) n=1 Tax=Bosea sp. 685 TaxID=3080057 RepID=UPI002892AEFD|nr:MDR family oxidoreductase [Bosea sp. 685]WNJ88012.1 MDR family oxidoreductase [Bosea sp. 685]
MFRGILIDKDDKGQRVSVTDLSEDRLPAGDVTVRVEASTINYKDALAITGKGPIVRSFPMVPGIDFAGVVEHSDHPEFAPGDRVLLNGWGVGEQHWGGLAERARVRGEWLIRLPEALTAKQAMAIGTAGYTAMLCIMALERFGLEPGRGEVLVTGASGGVGSIAVALLNGLGYRVVASTGRMLEEAYLKDLGAAEVIDRSTLSEPGKPLQRERWAAVVDSVGSHTLANACASTKADGAVAACGMAQGLDLPTSVAPFILRGVALLGINSVTRPIAERVEAWRRLSENLDALKLETVTRTIQLAEVADVAEQLMAGQVRGRVVIDLEAGG